MTCCAWSTFGVANVLLQKAIYSSNCKGVGEQWSGAPQEKKRQPAKWKFKIVKGCQEISDPKLNCEGTYPHLSRRYIGILIVAVFRNLSWQLLQRMQLTNRLVLKYVSGELFASCEHGKACSHAPMQSWRMNATIMFYINVLGIAYS